MSPVAVLAAGQQLPSVAAKQRFQQASSARTHGYDGHCWRSCFREAVLPNNSKSAFCREAVFLKKLFLEK